MSDNPVEISLAVAIALGDRRRPLILQLLEQGPLTAAAVANALDITAAAATHHLTVLQGHGWVHIAGTVGRGRNAARLWATPTPGISWARITRDLNALPGQLRPAFDAAKNPQ